MRALTEEKCLRLGVMELIEKYFLLCTDLSETEIKETASGGPRDAKLRLAWEIVKIYCGEKAANSAKEEFINVFSDKNKPKEIETINLAADKMTLLNLLIAANLANSKNQARRLIRQGGVKINNEKKTDPYEEIQLQKETLIQAGPRRFVKVKKN